MTKIIRLIVNAIVISASFLLAFILRYGLPLPEKNFKPYIESFSFLTVIFLLALLYSGVFQRRFRSYWQLFQTVFAGVLTGTLFSFCFLYILRVKWTSFPSSVFAINFPVAVILLFISNTIILRLKGRLVKKVIILGDDRFINPYSENESLAEIKHIHKISELLDHNDVDEIVICEYIHQDSELNLLIYLLNKLKVVVTFSPMLYAKLLSGNITEENSLKYLATAIGRRTELEEFFIRCLDVFGSAVMLLFGFIPMAVIAIIIKLTSKGPVFYLQNRIGKDGKPFMLYKFRTMFVDAEAKTGPVLASQQDPRITSVGRFLRQHRLDELPQLVNIIVGDMSLVGPRPERPHFIQIHKALRGIRLAVKPGLTGLAQIRNEYDLEPKHKMKYDYLYIQRRSLLLNLYILIGTVPIMLFKKGQ